MYVSLCSMCVVCSAMFATHTPLATRERTTLSGCRTLQDKHLRWKSTKTCFLIAMATLGFGVHNHAVDVWRRAEIERVLATRPFLSREIYFLPMYIIADNYRAMHAFLLHAFRLTWFSLSNVTSYSFFKIYTHVVPVLVVCHIDRSDAHVLFS